jgi:hypothetical protein
MLHACHLLAINLSQLLVSALAFVSAFFFCVFLFFNLEASTKRQRGGWRDEVQLAWWVILQRLLFCFQDRVVGTLPL